MPRKQCLHGQAVTARHALGLDEVLLTVANRPWQKVGTRSITPAADRLAMVENRPLPEKAEPAKTAARRRRPRRRRKPSGPAPAP